MILEIMIYFNSNSKRICVQMFLLLVLSTAPQHRTALKIHRTALKIVWK